MDSDTWFKILIIAILAYVVGIFGNSKFQDSVSQIMNVLSYQVDLLSLKITVGILLAGIIVFVALYEANKK